MPGLDTDQPQDHQGAGHRRADGLLGRCRRNHRIVRDVADWHECDLRAAPINVRSWESNGLNADVAFGPFKTPSRHCDSNSGLSSLSQ
jgi:hypothetical protein